MNASNQQMGIDVHILAQISARGEICRRGCGSMCRHESNTRSLTTWDTDRRKVLQGKTNKDPLQILKNAKY